VGGRGGGGGGEGGGGGGGGGGVLGGGWGVGGGRGGGGEGFGGYVGGVRGGWGGDKVVCPFFLQTLVSKPTRGALTAKQKENANQVSIGLEREGARFGNVKEGRE